MKYKIKHGLYEHELEDKLNELAGEGCSIVSVCCSSGDVRNLDTYMIVYQEPLRFYLSESQKVDEGTFTEIQNRIDTGFKRCVN